MNVFNDNAITVPVQILRYEIVDWTNRNQRTNHIQNFIAKLFCIKATEGKGT